MQGALGVIPKAAAKRIARVAESTEIAPEVVDPDDVEMLQDLVLAAVNEAMDSAQKLAADKMGKITGGMNIPGLM